MKSGIWFLVIFFGVCCFGFDSSAESGSNVIKFGVHVSAMNQLDPHFASASQDRAFADMVFNGLLRYEPGNAPKMEADLAESIPTFVMEGGSQVWTVNLRKGVWFHPGPQTPAYEMTADDVIFSLKKSADKKFCAYANDYEGMTFEKKDDYTIRIVLEQPLSSILFLPKISDYAGGFIVSKKAMETMGYENFKHHPVGTGPFMFKSYEKDGPLILAAHDGYFRGKPLLDGVEIRFFPDFKAREAAFLNGDLDVIVGHGEKGWVEKAEKIKEIVVDLHGAGEVSAVYFNTRQKPLDDIRVRKAMAYALGRDVFQDAVSRRMAANAWSFVPDQFLPGGISEKEAGELGLEYEKDLDKARALMQAAGLSEGFSLDLVTSEKRLFQAYYQALKDHLAAINIHCRIKVLPHSEMHREIRRDPRPIVIYSAWRPNADVYLTQFFHSDAIVVTGSRPDTNFSHYDGIDKLIEAARLEIDPDKQISLWVQAQIRILSDMAALPILCTTQCYARKARVDYGHVLVSSMALYPQFTEKTRFVEDR